MFTFGKVGSSKHSSPNIPSLRPGLRILLAINVWERVFQGLDCSDSDSETAGNRSIILDVELRFDKMLSLPSVISKKKKREKTKSCKASKPFHKPSNQRQNDIYCLFSIIKNLTYL